MDYYLISTGTGISIYTRPMSLAPTIDDISRFNVSRIQKSSRREVKKVGYARTRFFLQTRYILCISLRLLSVRYKAQQRTVTDGVCGPYDQ